MFNFSANHLALIQRMEYYSCVVFLMKDHYTQRLYRLYDFSKSQIIRHDGFYCVAGKVNQRRQALSGDRIGQEGCQTPVGFPGSSSPRVRRRQTLMRP